MADSQPKDRSTHEQWEDELQQLQLSLPKEEWFKAPLCFYQGFWCPTSIIYKEVSAFQNHFQATDTDLILASLPKTGTTWLKSLIYTIVNRKNLSEISQHILRSKNPHELVLHLEYKLYVNNQPDLTNIPSPRLFATHLPYSTIPKSIKTSKCRIVYICRNPLDNFISVCHFWALFDMNKGIKLDMDMIEEHMHKYCKGIFPHGPYDDHLLGYWKESIENPQKVLFLEYEGLKKEPHAHLKKLADFMGYPFSEEEEKENVVDEILELCSLKNLKEMEVNKSGKFYPWFGNNTLFRKGEVGDWTNYLTPSMAKGFDEIHEKLKNAGFSFGYYDSNLLFEATK
ncbi:Cytosolic sulfotransferase 15 [Bienertia sinuspersici]